MNLYVILFSFIVDIHNSLKETRAFACGCSETNFKLKNFSKFAWKRPAGVLLF